MANEATDIRLPSEQEQALAKRSQNVLARLINEQHPTIQLQASHHQDEILELSQSSAQLISRLLTEIADGNAVTLIPVHAELTTGQAAELLNVSRPHLVSLLENGVIEFHRVGTHRRLYAQDVLSYKAQTADKRQKALAELTDLSQQQGMGY